VKETVEAGVRIITLQRDPMNTLDLGAIETLSAFFAGHPPGMPLVLEGSAGLFSAGVDSRAFGQYTPVERIDLARAITRMTAHLLSIAAPVVAAVPGHALGGGLVLVLCCDHRVATRSETAKFGLFEARAGIAFPAGPALIVQSELSSPLLRHLTLSCGSVSSEELLRQRVFDELADPDDVASTARDRARDLAQLPGFQKVKAQMRGALAAAVRKLAAEGHEPAFEV